MNQNNSGNSQTIYAEVILPLPLSGTYTYSIPDTLTDKCKPGMRVIVQFGRKKIYSGIIRKIHYESPEYPNIKEIQEILDYRPLINEYQFLLWDWIASYYMAHYGEVYKAAVPSGLKLESETRVFLRKQDIPETEYIPDTDEDLLIRVLQDKYAMAINEIDKLSIGQKALTVVKNLVDKGIINIEEYLREPYKPKTEKFVTFSEYINSENAMNQTLNKLKKAPRQQELLYKMIELSGWEEGNNHAVRKKDLMKAADVSESVLKSLVKKGILYLKEKETGRLEESVPVEAEQKPLADFQEKAYRQILSRFTEKETVLLHGITSSGKTEIYIKLINYYLNSGQQVLYLLPEIALTTQIILRLKDIFGDRIGVYHSKFSDAERVEIWNKISNPGTDGTTKYQIILGVRSAIFLPFHNLGLIIVDEEHENTYKQFNPAPRYHGRDAALMLARIHGAKALLGTATPAYESYFNARKGKYGLVELNQRYGDVKLPEIIRANLQNARRTKHNKTLFTPLLLDNMTEALKHNKQVILFKNRRGFSQFLQCKNCGWVPKCKFCDVSLTYHKITNQLTCHYCGYAIHVPSKCHKCDSPDIEMRGFGTERIEDDLHIHFPEARISRMDLDSTRSKKAYEKIITDFQSGAADILIGTQMVTKGLDFDNVQVVGILNADNMLNFPDFRAFERSYQLMQQVSGRAGRRDERGKVIIQTFDKNHPVIQKVLAGDYTGLYAEQMAERKLFGYPPYMRLIKITIKHPDKDTLNTAAENLKKLLIPRFGTNLLGPQYPLVTRVQNYYINDILIKIARNLALSEEKSFISQKIQEVTSQKGLKNLRIAIDVDPL